MNFKQLHAAKKEFKNDASQQMFVPPYFDRALVSSSLNFSHIERRFSLGTVWTTNVILGNLSFFIVLSKTKTIIDSPHVHLDFSGVSNSLAMVDTAEIEQLEPFLKEKARQQMTQTLLLICAHYHRQKSRP